MGEDFLGFRELNFVGENEYIFLRNEVFQSYKSLLEERLIGKKTKKMLGACLATEGPETFSASSGHDANIEVIHVWMLSCFG